MWIVDVPVAKFGFDGESYDGERLSSSGGSKKEDFSCATYSVQLKSYCVLRTPFSEDTALADR